MEQNTSHKTAIIVGILIFLAIGAGAWYWFSFMRSMPADVNVKPGNNNTTNGGATPFKPLSTNNVPKTPTDKTKTLVGQTGSTTGSSTTATINKIRKLSENPVAGAVATTTPKGVSIRYVDKTSGHIYEIGAKDVETKRITNLTIPKVLQAIWHNNASNVVYRYEREAGAPITDLSLEIQEPVNKVVQTGKAIASKTITEKTPTKVGTSTANSNNANAASETSTNDNSSNSLLTNYLLNTKTTILGTNSYTLALAPKSKRVFILENNGNGKPVGIISNLNGTQPVTVFENGSSAWNAQWPEESTIILNTKPISIGVGFTYKLNIADKSLSKIGEGGGGLTTLVNSTLSTALATYSDAQKILTMYFNLKSTDQNTSIREATFNTMPEKCVWSKNETSTIYCAVPERIIPGNYPEAWYQGDVSFTDNIWKIDTVKNSAVKIADMYIETDELIDGTQLSIDSNDSVLVLINKRDQSLWQINLK